MSEDVLNELQLLCAMYDPTDVNFHDSEVLNLVENCIPISDSVSLSVRVNEFVELDIRLPLGYPEKERLSAYCRISRKGSVAGLDTTTIQQWESQFNNAFCHNYISVTVKPKDTSGKGSEECDHDVDKTNILGAIQWCNEHFEKYPIPSEKNGRDSSLAANSSRQGSTSGDDPNTPCCRIWIFSHHIYNKNKRKFLVNTADELDLSGFSLPGKPGFICVEGDPQNCDEYWSRTRQLCWQKISLIERQICASSEMIFEKKSFKELQCDKSAFIKFLEEKNCSEIIKDYLGF